MLFEKEKELINSEENFVHLGNDQKIIINNSNIIKLS